MVDDDAELIATPSAADIAATRDNSELFAKAGDAVAGWQLTPGDGALTLRLCGVNQIKERGQPRMTVAGVHSVVLVGFCGLILYHVNCGISPTDCGWLLCQSDGVNVLPSA